jgi:hypothetical protein
MMGYKKGNEDYFGQALLLSVPEKDFPAIRFFSGLFVAALSLCNNRAL